MKEIDPSQKVTARFNWLKKGFFGIAGGKEDGVEKLVKIVK